MQDFLFCWRERGNSSCAIGTLRQLAWRLPFQAAPCFAFLSLVPPACRLEGDLLRFQEMHSTLYQK